MIMRSTKSTVSQSTPCLSCETLMSVKINASDNAAEMAGRRNRVNQNPFRIAQVSKNAALLSGPHSVQKLMTIAVRWIRAMPPASKGLRRHAAMTVVQPRVKNEKVEDMAVIRSWRAWLILHPAHRPSAIEMY